MLDQHLQAGLPVLKQVLFNLWFYMGVGMWCGLVIFFQMVILLFKLFYYNETQIDAYATY